MFFHLCFEEQSKVIFEREAFKLIILKSSWCPNALIYDE